MTMSDKPKLPVMPLFVGDFLGSTRVQELTATAKGLYLLLLTHEWNMGGKGLTADAGSLGRILGASDEELAIIERDVLGFFTLRQGRYYNCRMESEIKAAIEQKETFRTRAQTAAAIRWKRYAERHATSSASSITKVERQAIEEKPADVEILVEFDEVVYNRLTTEFGFTNQAARELSTRRTVEDLDAWIVWRRLKRVDQQVVISHIKRYANPEQMNIEKGKAGG